MGSSFADCFPRSPCSSYLPDEDICIRKKAAALILAAYREISGVQGYKGALQQMRYFLEYLIFFYFHLALLFTVKYLKRLWCG